ncbi:hypothetical protein EDE11_1421 [Methylomonas methanica]|uniref:Uncharacterized protein n=3 Tax=Methylococcaceae TaxID=403 RepID=A0A126T4B6_9GAMM|nr:hypothetical protein JT25_010480 [Methylomonas denitrificans]TCV73867.1 hypothetical protein EDE11_1421 [Methylomonas methanica]
MLEDGQCQLERKSDLALSSYTKHELLGFIGSGVVILGGQESITVTATVENNQRLESDLSAYSEKMQQEANYKYSYVKRADDLLGENVNRVRLPKVIKLVADENNDPHPPSPFTVRLWWKNWIKADRSIITLIENKRGPKNKRRIVKECQPALKIFH